MIATPPLFWSDGGDRGGPDGGDRDGRAILDYAERRGIDLIVLGRKTKSTIERFFIGTMVEKVVRHAAVSVLIVRDEDESV